MGEEFGYTYFCFIIESVENMYTPYSLKSTHQNIFMHVTFKIKPNTLLHSSSILAPLSSSREIHICYVVSSKTMTTDGRKREKKYTVVALLLLNT